MKAAIVVLSDKGAAGQREDLSGPALKQWLQSQGVEAAHLEVLPDDEDRISEKLVRLCDSGQYDLLLTTGGTGVSPRDVTPDATLKVLDRTLPGFGEVMRMRSLQKTPHAIISRAVAGIRGATLIVNLPGSPRGAVENLEAVWDAVPHAVAKLQGDPRDCGEEGQ